jgi:hypothetical protein
LANQESKTTIYFSYWILIQNLYGNFFNIQEKKWKIKKNPEKSPEKGEKRKKR